MPFATRDDDGFKAIGCWPVWASAFYARAVWN